MSLNFADGKNISIGKKWSFTTRDLAVFSICVYIICAIVFENTQISFQRISSIALYFCLGCCALNCVVCRKISFHWISGIFVLLGVLIWISCLYTPASAAYTKGQLYRYWTSLILCLCIISAKPNKQDIFKIAKAFVVAGVVLSIYIYLFYGLENLANSGNRLGNEDFGHANIIGSYAALAAMLAVYLLVVLKKNRLLYILACAICLPCVLFSGSRKALIVFLICVLAVVLMSTKNVSLVKKILLVAGIIALVWLIVFYVPAFEPIKERFLGLFEFVSGEEATVDGDENRVYYVTKGIEAFLEKPIFGQGFGYSYHIFGTYSHNNYIELLMCHGIVGFVVYYSVFVILAILTHRAKIDTRLKTFVYLIMVKLLVEDIGVVSYYNRITFVLFAVLISACCSVEKSGSLESKL